MKLSYALVYNSLFSSNGTCTFPSFISRRSFVASALSCMRTITARRWG